MLDYNTRQLVSWGLKEFRTPLLLAAAGALAAGYAFGCFSKARAGRGGGVSVFDLNGDPARYNARTVCVKGTLLNMTSGAEDQGLPYAVFSLKEAGASGDYDFINVISFKERTAPPGGTVMACGVFSSVKQVGKDTYHNVIFLNRFIDINAMMRTEPVIGARKSRAF
jgi:hypothetical protein